MDDTIQQLLSTMNPLQMKRFLEKLLKKRPDLIDDDLTIFLQGQTVTPITIAEHTARFLAKLEQLDLNALLELWYREGEDYYEGDWNDRDFPHTDSLSDVVDGLIGQAETYEDNQNYGEALKVYQALFEALCQKQESLEGDHAELSDVFVQESEKVVDRYIRVGIKTNSDPLKQIVIAFLCSQFNNPNISINQEPVVSGLRQIITMQEEAVYALSRLEQVRKKNTLSITESSLLAFLYAASHQWQLFESISCANMETNPGIALDFLRFLQKNDRTSDMMAVADKVLGMLVKRSQDRDAFVYPTSSDDKRIEIQIRQFLKSVPSQANDYPRATLNLERLFLLTGTLSDYKELAGRYENTAQKESFWKMMKEYFKKEDDVKTIFNVFRFENQKQEVLDLLRTCPDSNCFPEMVDFIKDKYPMECFEAYKKKISDLLQEPKVERYAPAAYHLTRMQTIGQKKDFLAFVEWIKTTYQRRRRLMEELQNHHVLG